MHSNYSRVDYRSRGGIKPSILVIHDTEGSSFKSDLAILQAVKHDPKLRTVSVHYLIGPGGEIASEKQGLVDIKDSAYHTGISSWGNARQEINENSAEKMGFYSWNDYLKNRGETRDVECDYIHNVLIDSIRNLEISQVEKLEYVESGEKYVIDNAKDVKLNDVKNVLINVAYGVKIQKAQGFTIKEAVGLNDISIGIELTNPGDQPFTQKQMESLFILCAEILETQQISIFDIIAHADIAPTRKQDPSSYFLWKDLYTNLVSRVRTEKLRCDLEKMVKIFNSTCEDPSKVLLNKSSKDEKLIRVLEEGLLKYGYRSLTTGGTYSADLAATVNAFNRHFCPETFIKEKKEGDIIIVNPKNEQWYKLSQQRLEGLLR